jgi:hypothetical protein
MKKLKISLIVSSLIFLPYNILFAQWTQTALNSGYVNAMMTYGTDVFAGTGSGIYLTTNMGDNWTMVFNISGRSFTSSGANIFAGTQSNGVYLSTNGGMNWTQVNNGLTANYVRGLAVHGTNVFAGTTTAGVFLSTNNGGNWSPVNNGLTNLYVFALFVHDNNIFAGTDNTGAIFRSTNDGASWTLSGAQYDYTYAFTSNGINIFAGTDLHGCYITTDNGNSWSQVNNGMPDIFVNSMASYKTTVFAGTHQGVAYTTNNGAQWIPFSTGLPANPWIYGMAVDSPYIFAGLYSPQQGVWRRLLSDLVPVKKISESIPESFALYQNYPNPFNPSTKIKFSIPPFTKGGFVTMKIYDLIGHEVATLVNEKLQPGSYEVEWDGINCPSSVYLYRLTTTYFTQTRKMILLK